MIDRDEAKIDEVVNYKEFLLLSDRGYQAAEKLVPTFTRILPRQIVNV